MIAAIGENRCSVLLPSRSSPHPQRPHQQRPPHRQPCDTCSSIADCGPSATSPVISSPRIIGPGCITSGFGANCASRSRSTDTAPHTPPGPAPSQPAAPSESAASSPHSPAPAHGRSRAQSQRFRRLPVLAQRERLLRQQLRGPHSTTRAPSRGSSIAFDRATRLCRMSPVITTVTPPASSHVQSRAPSPSRSSIVRRSSSACDGC